MSRRREAGPAGVLLVDKPAGLTSHDVVWQVRRSRGGRVGHAGTLDPFATGLLVILLGPATRLMQYVLELPKTYEAVARLGWRSSTGDPDGELSQTGVVPADLALPTGRVVQKVPMTSAVRVAGERLYERAHRGETIETPEREVLVHRAELKEAGERTATYEIECSTGTYVRALIETLSDAYCERLRRTAIGRMRVEDAVPAPFDADALEPALAVAHLPAIELDEAGEVDARQGRALPAAGGGIAPGARLRMMHGGRLVGIGVEREGLVHPRTVLA